MMLLTGSSAFGGSIPSLFISKSKIFEAERLSKQTLFHDHDYAMKSGEKSFITEVLFIIWLQMQFIPKYDQLRIKAHYDRAILVLVGGHASHIPPRVVAYADSQRIIILRLGAPLFRIS
jgi:hypothetical protein